MNKQGSRLKTLVLVGQASGWKVCFPPLLKWMATCSFPYEMGRLRTCIARYICKPFFSSYLEAVVVNSKGPNSVSFEW